MQTKVEAPVTEPRSISGTQRRGRAASTRRFGARDRARGPRPARCAPARCSAWSAPRAAASRRCSSWWPGLQEPDAGDRVGGRPARGAPTCPSATCCCRGATRSATPRWRWSARACAAQRARARARAAAVRALRAGGVRGTRARPTCPAACASAWRSCARCCPGRPVLLLDEPFAALDAITRAEMQQWLADALERRAAHGAAGDPRRGGGAVPVRPRGGAEPRGPGGWWPSSTCPSRARATAAPR